MGYFTETMNAITEVKGDAEAYHAASASAERALGDHKLGKMYSKNKSTMKSMDKDAANAIYPPMRNKQDYENRRNNAEAMKQAAEKTANMDRKTQADATRNQLKACGLKEYFDAAFEEACGGGGKKKKKENKGSCESKKGGCR